MSSTPEDNTQHVVENGSDRSTESGTSLEVKIAGDGSLATLIVPERFDPDELDMTLVLRCVKERGVTLDEENRGRLEELVKSFCDDPRRIEQVIARATPPEDGIDGRLEWVDCFDPEQQTSPAQQIEPEGRVDFYNQVSYISIEHGDHIATIIQPTEGKDGCDVTGASIPAKPGKPTDVKIDSSLTVAEDGRVLAQTAGVLEFNDRTLAIARLMEVSECVDFSTGNINFDGSVHVREGVRDRFVVKTTENLAVDGLVEAATIVTGKDFHCRRGMAAKDRGQILVGGDAHVGYLNNVRGRVRGHLFVRRELMDCELIVGKSLSSSQGTIVGGRVIVTGPAEVAGLGSGGGTPTQLVLGEVPLLASQVHRLDMLIRESRAEMERLRDPGDGGGPVPEGRLPTAVQAKLARLLQTIEECTRKREELVGQIPALRSVNLLVNKVIRAKVQVRIADREFLFEDDVKGPVKIEWDARRQIIFRRGDGEAGPIFDYAREINLAA
jgi:uncharacterized protein (DUF342 family)